MAQYTAIINYVTYDFNDKHGKVPWADDSVIRGLFAIAVRVACGLSDS